MSNEYWYFQRCFSLIFALAFTNGIFANGVVDEKPNDGSEYYNEAVALLKNSASKRKHDNGRAFELLLKAAELNHTQALEMIAFEMLYGENLKWDAPKAKDLFESLSKQGSTKSQLGLAFMHSVGIATNSSQAIALIYYTFAALGGEPLAQMALGYRFSSGINLPQVCESALTYYRKVADRVAETTSFGLSTAVQRLRLTEDAEDPSSGTSTLMEENLLQYYKFLADKGDVGAQVGLGQLYLTGGRGVELNYDLARHYFFLAADAGSTNAMGFLGKMYLDGTPVTPADNLTAFQYFKRSADKGNAIGQSGLGYMYLSGLGVENDFDKAYKLLSASAEQGNVDAQLQLGLMFYHGLGVAEDFSMALKYFQLASQSGSVFAMYNLGQMHSLGLGVLRNCHTAVEFFKNVAERGKWSSMLMEAYNAYQNGEVPFQNEDERNQRALLLWDRAANQGSSFARVKVADYHYYGKGTPVDYEEAVANYKVASELQRNAQAMFNLGYMHEQGIGIRRDLHLAKRFYDMAVEVSPDATLPVNLALIRLSFLFLIDFFKQSLWWKLEFVDRAFGPYWDFYLVPLLCAVIAEQPPTMFGSLVKEARRFKSFFTKRKAEDLWKGVTSVSNVGRKKGRARSVLRPKDLNRGQEIGKGPINTMWPGLNSPLMAGKELLEHKYLPPDPGRAERLLKLREGVKMSRISVHPLERGWSGTSLKGRILGPPECLANGKNVQSQAQTTRTIAEENGDTFKTIVLETKSVRHMTARLGLVKRISLLAVVGNGNGLAGFAFAKHSDSKLALKKASNMAAKRLKYVERLQDHTIYQDFWAECRSTQLFVQRMPEGYGLRCHRAIRAICQLIGIRDLFARVEGNTKNYQAIAKAFFDGLLKQETHQQLAERKRLLVVEFRKELGYLPKVVARPVHAELRLDSEIEPDEELDLDDLYGQGRYPYRRRPRQPFWINSDGYLKKLWREHPYRNMEKVKLTLRILCALDAIGKCSAPVRIILNVLKVSFAMRLEMFAFSLVLKANVL
ncbi:ribosomal protein S5 domain protein [Trichuris suis]|nr:ribosomal protein S5 domain protein [Trichuris suis]